MQSQLEKDGVTFLSSAEITNVETLRWGTYTGLGGDGGYEMEEESEKKRDSKLNADLRMGEDEGEKEMRGDGGAGSLPLMRVHIKQKSAKT